MSHSSKILAGFIYISWCRRRDSNSHSFRHYPLKIACLPISPRRHCLQCGKTTSINRESLQDLNYNWLNQFVQRTKSDPRENYFGTSEPAADDGIAAEPDA